MSRESPGDFSLMGNHVGGRRVELLALMTLLVLILLLLLLLLKPCQTLLSLNLCGNRCSRIIESLS